jgi:hypothetical protein
MKKLLGIVVLGLLWCNIVLAEFVPLFKYPIGTKEFVKEYCPSFNDGKNNCLDSLNLALKYGYKITDKYKKDKKTIIYMLQKRNKVAICKININDSSSYCRLVE